MLIIIAIFLLVLLPGGLLLAPVTVELDTRKSWLQVEWMGLFRWRWAYLQQAKEPKKVKEPKKEKKPRQKKPKKRTLRQVREMINRRVNINFTGDNYVLLRVTNRPWRMLAAWLQWPEYIVHL